LLGPGPLEGLYLATGHHRNGVLLAAITAELVSECVFGTIHPQGEQRLKAFNWRRFATD